MIGKPIVKEINIEKFKHNIVGCSLSSFQSETIGYLKPILHSQY